MRRILKWIGISLVTLTGAALLAVAVLVFLGGRKLSATRTVEVASVAVPGDAAAIERGAHLARTRCVFCHGDDLGGKKFIDDAAFMVVNAPNLTRGEGGRGGDYTSDAAWVRALRHGVNAQGRALIVMPAGASTSENCCASPRSGSATAIVARYAWPGMPVGISAVVMTLNSRFGSGSEPQPQSMTSKS